MSDVISDINFKFIHEQVENKLIKENIEAREINAIDQHFVVAKNNSEGYRSSGIKLPFQEMSDIGLKGVMSKSDGYAAKPKLIYQELKSEHHIHHVFSEDVSSSLDSKMRRKRASYLNSSYSEYLLQTERFYINHFQT